MGTCENDTKCTSTNAGESFWTPRGLAAASGGRWIHEPVEPDAALQGLTIDSRTLQAGQAFLALKGERHDGHDFATAAAEAGAATIIIDADRADVAAELSQREFRGGLLGVASPLQALQQLASHYRDILRDHQVKVIAVTGSNGKTTTRNLIHAALACKLSGTQSPHSFNNHIGLPLTLLAASVDDDFVVAEVGTNHPGEIAALTAIAQPDIAVITSIGSAHIGHFGTREAIAVEKAALLTGLAADGLAVIPAGEPLLDEALNKLPTTVKTVRVGEGSAADLRYTSLEPMRLSEPLRFTFGRRVQVSLPLLGRHNVLNALMAVGVGRFLGLDDADMAQALSRTEAVAMRLQVLRLGDPANPIVVINDAYNANPDSVMAALDMLAQLLAEQPSRSVVILGDMLELGEQAPDAHRSIGAALAEMPDVALAVLIGRLSLFTAEALARQWPEHRMMAIPVWDDTVPTRVAARLNGGDLVLVKGSRGMGLERIVEQIASR